MKIEVLAAATANTLAPGTIIEPYYGGTVTSTLAGSYTGNWQCNATGYYEIIAVGGGGGGGGGNDNTSTNAGHGGDSGWAQLGIGQLSKGSTYSYTIGAGGQSTNNPGGGTTGTNSSFQSVVGYGGSYAGVSNGNLSGDTNIYVKYSWGALGWPDYSGGASYGSTNGSGDALSATTLSSGRSYRGRVFSQLDGSELHGHGGGWPASPGVSPSFVSGDGDPGGSSYAGGGGGGGWDPGNLLSNSFTGYAGSGGGNGQPGGGGYGAGGGGANANNGDGQYGGRGARGYIRLKYLGQTPNTAVYTASTPNISNVWVANVEIGKSYFPKVGSTPSWYTVIHNPYSANTQQARAVTNLTDGSNTSANAVDLGTTNTGCIWITLDKVPLSSFTLQVTCVSGDTGVYYIGGSNYTGNGGFLSNLVRTAVAPGNPGPFPGVRNHTIQAGYKNIFITAGSEASATQRIQDIRIV